MATIQDEALRTRFAETNRQRREAGQPALSWASFLQQNGVGVTYDEAGNPQGNPGVQLYDEAGNPTGPVAGVQTYDEAGQAGPAPAPKAPTAAEAELDATNAQRRAQGLAPLTMAQFVQGRLTGQFNAGVESANRLGRAVFNSGTAGRDPRLMDPGDVVPTDVMQRLIEGQGQLGEQALERGEANKAEFKSEVDNRLGAAQNALNDLYDPLQAQLDALPTNPDEIYRRMLSNQLNQAAATGGRTGARRAAAFRTRLGSGGLLAEAEEQNRQNLITKNKLYQDFVNSKSEQEQALFKEGIAASRDIFNSMQALGINVAQLNQAEQAFLGNLALGLQELINKDKQFYDQLDSNEKIAYLEDATRRYGIDKDLEGVLARIDAEGKITAKDWFGFATGIASGAAKAGISALTGGA